MDTIMIPDYLKSARRVSTGINPTKNKKQPQEQTKIQENLIEQMPAFLKNAKPIQPASQERYKFEEEGDLERDIERQQARMTSRGIETVLGLPGDLLSFASGLFGKEQNILPTSQSLQEKSEKLTAGYTKPQTELEGVGDEFIKDFVSMATPGSASYGIVRNIGIPLASTLAKEGLKYSGVEDKNASAAKMGMMIGLDLIAHRKAIGGGSGAFGGGARSFSGNLFHEAEQALPKGVSVKAEDFEKSLNALENTLKMGGNRPSTQAALEKIKEMKSGIKKGKINVQELASFRPSINEIIDSFGGFDMKLRPAIKNKAIANLNDVKGAAIKTLSEYGERFNPKFLQLHKAANESWEVYSKSNKVANFLKKKIGDKALGTTTKALLGIVPVGTAAGVFLSPVGTGVASSVGLLGTAGYQGYKIFDRVMKSPTLRSYYSNVLTGALKGNTAQVVRNVNDLDKALKKEDLSP